MHILHEMKVYNDLFNANFAGFLRRYILGNCKPLSHTRAYNFSKFALT